ncbi:MAG: lytic transglycosylase domain-containing protein, partial [Flavitalea sp.]
MMKQTLIFFLSLTAYVVSVQAGNGVIKPTLTFPSPAQDTTLTPTTAPTITDPVSPDMDVAPVLHNEPITAKMIKLNPRAVSFVQDYMTRNTRDLTYMKQWAKPYFDTMEGILVKNNLPIELKYLAVVESKLKAGARSGAGAVGPWQ